MSAGAGTICHGHWVSHKVGIQVIDSTQSTHRYAVGSRAPAHLSARFERQMAISILFYDGQYIL